MPVLTTCGLNLVFYYSCWIPYDIGAHYVVTGTGGTDVTSNRSSGYGKSRPRETTVFRKHRLLLATAGCMCQRFEDRGGCERSPERNSKRLVIYCI